MTCESDDCIQVAHLLPSNSLFVTGDDICASGANHRVFVKGFIHIKVIL